MKLKRKSIVSSILILSGLSLTGCSSSTLTEEDVNEFMSYVFNQTANSEVNFNEFEEQISKYISKIGDKEKTSQIINDYIYVLYNEVNQYISYFNIIGDDLDIIKKNLNIESIDVSMHKDISKESKVIGAILEEMQDRNLMVIDKNNLYTVEVDMKKIIEKFEKYLTTDLIEFMNFRSDENINPAYDNNTDKFDIDILLNRASTAIDYIENNKESSQLSNWQSTADYYYQLIFAEYTSQFLDTSTEVKKISSDYLKELKDKLEGYKSTLIYDDIAKYIELLEKNDYNIEAEEVANHRSQVLKSIFKVGKTEIKSEVETTPEDASNIEIDSITESDNK